MSLWFVNWEESVTRFDSQDDASLLPLKENTNLVGERFDCVQETLDGKWKMLFSHDFLKAAF